MSGTEALRVLDFGRVGPLRSQTLWHALAHGVSAGAPPTLSFLRPSDPYVCVGYHRRIEELDLDECERRGLPVYRRMVGGGPVYLDDGQLFFQIVVPVGSVSPVRTTALARLLAPAVTAFRAAGVEAELDDAGEIVLGEAKISGHGAGQIGEAVVVVGNLIERFDHDAASAVLAAPSPAARAEARRLMGRYVTATPADPARFQAAAVTAYAAALGLTPRPGRLQPGERAELARLDRRFCERRWVRGPARPAPAAWQAKVRAGIWVLAAEDEGTEVVATIVDERLERVQVTDPELNGSRSAVERALVGTRLADAARVLAPYGLAGGRVATALAKGDGRRL